MTLTLQQRHPKFLYIVEIYVFIQKLLFFNSDSDSEFLNMAPCWVNWNSQWIIEKLSVYYWNFTYFSNVSPITYGLLLANDGSDQRCQQLSQLWECLCCCSARSQVCGKLKRRPPLLFNVGCFTLSQMASFTPLLNQSSSLSSTLKFLVFIVCPVSLLWVKMAES